MSFHFLIWGNDTWSRLKYSSVWYVAESVMCFSLWIFWVFLYHFNFCEAICSLATPYVVFTISVALLFFYFLIKAVRADLISPWCGCRVPTGGHLLCVGLLAAVFVKLSRRDDRLDVLGVASLQWWQLMCAGIADIWGRGLDGFGGILLADEDLQQAEFGLDPLVLSVRLQHRHPVLLLNISKRGTRADRVVRFLLWGFMFLFFSSQHFCSFHLKRRLFISWISLPFSLLVAFSHVGPVKLLLSMVNLIQLLLHFS